VLLLADDDDDDDDALMSLLVMMRLLPLMMNVVLVRGVRCGLAAGGWLAQRPQTE
jgi:hypothetical protein